MAFEELLPRIRNPIRTTEDLNWTNVLTLRGPTALRLGFETTEERSACPSRATGILDNETLVRRFIESWSHLDAAELAAYFTEDGTYHNVPVAPVTGRANIEAMIRAVIAPWSETRWEIVTLLSAGNVVVAERIDRTRAGERSVELPIVGVFELEEGKIRAWRDYFDLGTYTQAMT